MTHGSADQTLTAFEIACDESGSEGENLIDTRARIFAHGSTDVSIDEARGIMERLRHESRSTATELKSSALLKGSGLALVADLFTGNGPLVGRAKVYLVDKLYFAVSKIVDLAIEEEAYDQGTHLHADGSAREIALTLFREGPRAFPADDWERLLRQFVSFVRSKQRKGQKTPLDDLLETIDEVRLKARRRRVEEILSRLWGARGQLSQYETKPGVGEPARLDPLLPAVFMTASDWFDELGGPVRLVHDRQSALESGVNKTLEDIANNPHPEFPYFVALDAIVQVDSSTDPRIQVADIVAGFGRYVATSAMCGEATYLAELLQPLVSPNSLWADDRSWRELTGASV